MDKSKNLYDQLVFPVCALEEYCSMAENCSPIVDTIAIALRKILNDVDKEAHK